jgi:hypothetical protein
MLSEDGFKRRAISEIYLAKDSGWRHGGTVALQ